MGRNTKIIVAIIGAIAVIAAAVITAMVGRDNIPLPGVPATIVNENTINIGGTETKKLPSDNNNQMIQDNNSSANTPSPAAPPSPSPSPKIEKLSAYPIYSSQYVNYYGQMDGWRQCDLAEWNATESRGADNELYPNGFLFKMSGSASSIIKQRASFLLNDNYSSLTSTFLLDEESKSTGAKGKLEIIAEYKDGSEVCLYTKEDVTGGMVPQDIGELNLTGAIKLTFMLSLKNIAHIGIVFTNPTLTPK